MLCLASACFTLVAVEGALRCMPKTSLLYLDSAPRKLVTADYAHLLRPDPDPRVLISFRPHLDDTFMDKAVRTNAQGFRGPELREGTRRIVGIGDSVMFGWGVDDAETYMRRLERELATDYPDVEVVNTAVPGSGVAWVCRHEREGLTAAVNDPAGFADAGLPTGRASRALLLPLPPGRASLSGYHPGGACGGSEKGGPRGSPPLGSPRA